MFEDWYLNDLIEDKIKASWKLSDHYLIALLYKVLLDSKLDKILQKSVTIDEIIKQNNYIDESRYLIRWILEKMALNGYISKETDSIPIKYKYTGKTNSDNPEAFLNEAVKYDEECFSTFKLIKIMCDEFLNFVTGKKNGIDIFFTPESIALMDHFYTKNLFYKAHNIGGAKIVNYLMEDKQNPLVIELGGGMGGGLRHFLIQRSKEKLNMNNFRYYFTDVANKLLRNSKKIVTDIAPECKQIDFKKLDFNKSFEEQAFEPEQADIVWGVNSLHVAYDLEYTLKEILKLLKKGGSIVVAETVRAKGNSMLQQEIMLNTITSYWDVKIDGVIRKDFGFMHWRDWVNALNQAGFVNVKTIPDMALAEEKYDNCYVGIITGQKG